MTPTNDLWYIRFPDGRVVRAVDTAAVRQHIAAGRLPVGTRLRRSQEDKWRAIERFAEFSDLTLHPHTGRNGFSERHDSAPGGTVASRLDPAQLHQVGVRGIMEELLAALDSTFVTCKLQAAGIAGLLLGGLVGLSRLTVFGFGLEPIGLGWLLVVAGLFVVAWLIGVLSRTSYVELSHLRPARWSDGVEGAGNLTLRLALAYGLVGGLVVGVIGLVRWLPGLLLLHGEVDGDLAWIIAAQVVASTGVFLELVLWPLLLLALPLGPLLVIEGCTSLSALWQWLRLVRRGLVRLVVAEGLALGIALALALPLVVLLGLVSTGATAIEGAGASPGSTNGVLLAAGIARAVVTGLLAAVPVAYLVVANVFVYLHLHYEAPRRG